MSPGGSPVTNATDQIPWRGYSISTTSRKVREVCDSTVSNSCFNVL